MSKKTEVQKLYVDTALYHSVYYDWSDSYRVIQPYEEGTKEYEEYKETNQPMMNYYYPLPAIDTEKISKDEISYAKAIKDLPLCLVYLEKEGIYALALTGGGMDLSWEICEAYIRLGYCPPLEFCELPRLAGKKIDAKNRKIIEACIKTAEHVKSRAESIIKHLEGLKKEKVL
jgi:hypothetical protein